jgi:hypothetical protein
MYQWVLDAFSSHVGNRHRHVNKATKWHAKLSQRSLQERPLFQLTKQRCDVREKQPRRCDTSEAHVVAL